MVSRRSLSAVSSSEANAPDMAGDHDWRRSEAPFEDNKDSEYSVEEYEDILEELRDESFAVRFRFLSSSDLRMAAHI